MWISQMGGQARYIPYGPFKQLKGATLLHFVLHIKRFWRPG